MSKCLFFGLSMWDLKRKQNNMDCSCTNRTFLFSFWLLGKFFSSKNEHFCAKTEKHRSENPRETLLIVQLPRSPREKHA